MTKQMNQADSHAYSELSKRDPKKETRILTSRAHFADAVVNIFIFLFSFLIEIVFLEVNEIALKFVLIDGLFILIRHKVKRTWIADLYFSTKLCWFHHLLKVLVYCLHLTDTTFSLCNLRFVLLCFSVVIFTTTTVSRYLAPKWTFYFFKKFLGLSGHLVLEFLCLWCVPVSLCEFLRLALGKHFFGYCL